MQNIEFTGERYLPSMTEMMINLEHLSRYHAFAPYCRGKRVLDAACGMGYGSNLIAEFAEHVMGIDIAPEVIEHDRQSYSKPNLEFQTASIEKLPFGDNSFDVVVSLETIEHVDEHIQRKFCAEVKRVLKSDGVFIVSTPDKKWYTDAHGNWKNQFHVHEFYYDEFKNFLSGYFSSVEMLLQNIYPASIIWNRNSGAPLKIDGLRQTGEQRIDQCTPQRFDYIIAVCGNSKLPDIASVMTVDVDYKLISDFLQPYIRRIHELEALLRNTQYAPVITIDRQC